MIYITGDVHSGLFPTWETKKHGPNIKTALEYVKILQKNKLTCTLFLNGICLDLEKEGVKKLLEYDIEIGGHTYENFGNKKVNKVKSYIYRKLYGCVYGSRSFQRKDIYKTKKAFENYGLDMTSWRTHSFASNKHTFDLLRHYGVKVVSDLLGNTKPFVDRGLIHVPINIPVDNNTIAYGPNVPESRNPFAGCTKGRIRPNEWLEIVKKRVVENEKNGIDSLMLLHPATMAYLDDFKTFTELVKFLSKYKSGKVSEFKLENEK